MGTLFFYYMRYFLLFIWLLISLSCASQKRDIISRSTIKYESNTTTIRDLIEIDGYYPVSHELRYGACMFFEDGTWVQFPFKSGISQKETKINLISSVLSSMNNRQSNWGQYWGVYKVSNDTIIVHAYDKPGTLSVFKAISSNEIRYKIIDKNTIQKIYFRINSKSGDMYYQDIGESYWLEETPMNFISADSLPSSDNWLKENKWIWRNESDWKEYMQRIKLEKVKNK